MEKILNKAKELWSKPEIQEAAIGIGVAIIAGGAIGLLCTASYNSGVHHTAALTEMMLKGYDGGLQDGIKIATKMLTTEVAG